MNFLRTITLLFALMAQALPAALIQRAEQPVPCTMSCCEAEVTVLQISACGCMSAPESVPQRAPAQTPPATPGRDQAFQTQWIPLIEDFLFKSAEITSSVVAHPFSPESIHTAQPHVRLTVLFCSFLT